MRPYRLKTLRIGFLWTYDSEVIARTVLASRLPAAAAAASIEAPRSVVAVVAVIAVERAY